jgi:DNA-binding NarL/FixJ family response regulator
MVVFEPTSVLLAEEKSWLRELFRPTLTMLGCDVVAEAATAAEAVRLFDEYRPDIVLTNFRLAAGSGIDVTRGCLALNPEAYVVLLTTHGDDFTQNAAKAASAKGFIVKNRPIEEFVEALAAHLPASAAA